MSLVLTVFFSSLYSKAIDVGLVWHDSMKVNATAQKMGQPFSSSADYVPFETHVPFLSIYNHLIIYLFLPIHRQLVAFAFGSLATLISLSLFLGIELSQVSGVFLYLTASYCIQALAQWLNIIIGTFPT